jgi:hypothetical protein
MQHVEYLGKLTDYLIYYPTSAYHDINITRSTYACICYDMERENCVHRSTYGTEKREGKDSRYIQEASAPAAVTAYQICNMSLTHVHL